MKCFLCVLCSNDGNTVKRVRVNNNTLAQFLVFTRVVNLLGSRGPNEK